MIFNVGDRVRIKNLDFLKNHCGESPLVLQEMYMYAGDETTLVEIQEDFGWAILAVDNTRFYWNMRWLEPVDLDNRKVGTR